MRIGARVRALRNERGLTLADVAGRSFSIGLLSKLERDLVGPSLETLAHIAARLGVPPGALLVSDAEGALDRARGDLSAGRAALLLGDPGDAARTAKEALAVLDPPNNPDATAYLRARLMALAADATLAGGDASEAASWVRDASALGGTAAPGVATDRVRAQLETAWVLGALERRRGALQDAERTWGSCLGSLEEPPDAHPWWQYLRASVLGELGGLAEARRDLERARNLVARGASIASGLAQAAAPASALLSSWAAGGRGALPLSPEPALPHAALTLAVVAAAERLGRRLTLEAARLERAVWSPETRALAPDAPASRGFRRT